MIPRSRVASSVLVLLPFVACKDSGGGMPFQTVGRQPDIAPVMLNNELPFRYPPALYAQRVQGNVKLRIYINGDGEIVADSYRTAVPSELLGTASSAHDVGCERRSA